MVPRPLSLVPRRVPGRILEPGPVHRKCRRACDVGPGEPPAAADHLPGRVL